MQNTPAIPSDAFCLIIGAMKCGTTSLYDYLTEHPHVCPCVEKEPMFWSNPANQHSSDALERYQQLFAFEPGRHRYALEASTNYTKYPCFPGVPEALARSGLQPELIYVVRDPFDRIESHFNYALNTPFRSPSITDSHLVELSNYYLQLKRFEMFLPNAKVHVIDFRQLVSQPSATLGRVCEFLDIASFAQSDALPHSNATDSPTRVETAYRDSMLSRFGRRMPASIRSAAKQILRRLVPTAPRARLSIEERAYVHSQLERDMQAFSDSYGFDVKQWGF